MAVRRSRPRSRICSGSSRARPRPNGVHIDLPRQVCMACRPARRTSRRFGADRSHNSVERHPQAHCFSCRRNVGELRAHQDELNRRCRRTTAATPSSSSPRMTPISRKRRLIAGASRTDSCCCGDACTSFCADGIENGSSVLAEHTSGFDEVAASTATYDSRSVRNNGPAVPTAAIGRAAHQVAKADRAKLPCTRAASSITPRGGANARRS